MQLNILSVSYLFFRLAPFIIVSFFILQSIFNQDFRGFVYLIGLIISCFFTTIIGNSSMLDSTLNNDRFYTNKTISPKLTNMCNFISLTADGSPISRLPLGINVLSFTLFYIVWIVSSYDLVIQNIASLLLFPILLICECFFNFMNGCNGFSAIIFSLVFGFAFGTIWFYLIKSTGLVDLQLFNGISNKATCSRPSKTLYRCRVNRQPHS